MKKKDFKNYNDEQLQKLQQSKEKELKDIQEEINKRSEKIRANRANIQVTVEEDRGTPICLSETCGLQKECGNHDSAGDFRSEDGFTPNLQKKDGIWFCEQKETKSRGMLIWKNGKFVSYKGLYEDED